MEKSVSYKSNKISNLIEIDKLLKIKEEIIEGFIKNIEDDISLITIIGSNKSSTNQLFEKIINLYLNKENNEVNIESNENLSTESVQIFTYSFNSYNKMNKSKIIFFLVNCIDKKVFTNRIYAMIHTMSSIIIYNSINLNLSELEYISDIKKYFSNYGSQEDLIKSLSPKFIYLYKDLENSKIDKDKVRNTIEKEDIISNSFVKYYLDRSFLSYNSLNEKFLESLEEIISKSQISKNYRGKRIEGLTLKHLIIELINCINQNISFNISKM